ncbi:MAG: hypothetical protein R2911_23630 [Caldilineaceae bacterium]
MASPHPQSQITKLYTPHVSRSDAIPAKLIEREVDYANLSVSFATPDDQFPRRA